MGRRRRTWRREPKPTIFTSRSVFTVMAAKLFFLLSFMLSTDILAVRAKASFSKKTLELRTETWREKLSRWIAKSLESFWKVKAIIMQQRERGKAAEILPQGWGSTPFHHIKMHHTLFRIIFWIVKDYMALKFMLIVQRCYSRSGRKDFRSGTFAWGGLSIILLKFVCQLVHPILSKLGVKTPKIIFFISFNFCYHWADEHNK